MLILNAFQWLQNIYSDSTMEKASIKTKIFMQALTNYYPCCYRTERKVAKAT